MYCFYNNISAGHTSLLQVYRCYVIAKIFSAVFCDDMKVTVHVNSVDFIIYDKRWPVYRPPGPLRKNRRGQKKNTISNGESGEEGSVHRRDKRLKYSDS